jgi:phospholipase C
LPYELDVQAGVDASKIVLTFFNTGDATAVFQVRSGNVSDLVRTYTVQPGTQLSDTWGGSPYDLSVYGPNGFVRYFKGSQGTNAAALSIVAAYGSGGFGSITLNITNIAKTEAVITVLDAYSGSLITQTLSPGGAFANEWSLEQFFGWYDLIVTVAEDATFNHRLAGHVETGRDSFSDPAMGGLVALQG